MLVSALLITCTLASSSPLTADDDWPGWRGPGGNGVASGSPPTEWDEEHNVRWKAPLVGYALSSPVVHGELVFVTTAVPKVEAVAPAAPEDSQGPQGPQDGGRGTAPRTPVVEQEFRVLAFDRSSGAEVWNHLTVALTPHQGTHRDGSYASATPVTDGEHLIVSFGSFGLFGYTLAGELVWSVDLGDMDIAKSFGEGSSPVLHGDTVVLNWDHEGDSFIVALDKTSGEERWRRERAGSTSWTTPLIVEAEGGPLVVVGTARTVAYELKTGAERWVYDEDSGGRSSAIASPVVHDGVLLYSTGSRGGSFRAIELGAAEGEMAAEDDALLWRHSGDTPHVPSPIAHDGVLYSLKSNSGILSAFDALSGEPLYEPQRLSTLSNVYASPVIAAGRLYLVGRDGVTEIVATGLEPKTVAVNRLDDEFNASPAIAGDELYLRGRAHLYCIAAD